MRSKKQQHKQTTEAYLEWFGRYRWAWMVTLTFRHPVRFKNAERRLYRWLSLLQNEAGRPDFRYVCAHEKGAFNDHPHWHLLIGGISDEKDFSRWQREWEKNEGTARVLPFNGNQAGIAYLLKTFFPDGDFDLKISLSDEVSA